MCERLKRLREAKGWTQTRLARESGVSQTYISELEAGKSIPTIVIAQKLARALGVPLADLVDDAAMESREEGVVA
ncbi:MAG TPA: helix-turn-helix transcriptional regulator [Firmicutes bacterium]|nr:helix-turn-helix transcriptional regulator [Bacillota bacterium]